MVQFEKTAIDLCKEKEDRYLFASCVMKIYIIIRQI